MDFVLSIIRNVLTALYQYFWLSLLIALMMTICYLFVYENNKSGQGLRKTIKLWFSTFKSSSEFRILFFLCFYAVMIFFRTVLNRNLWLNPLNNMFGGWWIYEKDSSGNLSLTTDCIENIILFIPFSFLSLWFLSKKRKEESISKLTIQNIRYALCLTLVIEFSQLFLRVGTFQISDIVYNALGGILGSFTFWIIFRIYHRR